MLASEPVGVGGGETGSPRTGAGCCDHVAKLAAGRPPPGGHDPRQSHGRDPVPSATTGPIGVRHPPGRVATVLLGRSDLLGRAFPVEVQENGTDDDLIEVCADAFVEPTTGARLGE